MGKKSYTKNEIIKYGQYYWTREKASYCIRREIKLYDGRELSERLPKKVFEKELEGLEDPKEIIDALTRICKQQNIKHFGRKYEEQLAMRTLISNNPWITTSLRKDFEKIIYAQRKNPKDGKYVYDLFETKFLKFFLDLKKIQDPTMWASAQHFWGQALFNKPDGEKYRLWEDKEYKPAKKTIIAIVQVANQFMDYLKLREPKEFGSLAHLVPYTRSQMENHEANRKFSGNFKEGYFIVKEDWEEIEDLLTDDNFISEYLHGYDIYPFVKLSYDFGLRRSESLGVRVEDVRQQCLSVERQLNSINDGNPRFEITKGKYKRLTPYWHTTAKQTFNTINKIGKGKCQLVHPDTLTDKWKVAIDYLIRVGKIDKDYDIHDLRRTFITRSLRDHDPIDVMKACGHKNISTTMAYIRDERDLATARYVPEDAEVVEMPKRKRGA